MKSPFSEILEPYSGQIAPSLQDQYLCPADAPYEIVLGGKMKRVWHRPKWLWPVFWLLARGDILFPETGENIPTTLIVTPCRNAEGEPVQTWERTFHFPNHKRRRYASTMVYDPPTRRMIELQGPKNAFEEIAKIRFTPPDRLEFLTVESVIQLGRFRLRLPRKLWITAHVVQQVQDIATGASRVTLTITHGLFGPIFGYEGEFRAARRPRRVEDGVVRP